MPSARVIKAVMHHQYRPNNLEKLYGAQHYTYGYKVQLLLRAIGRLGRYQGVLSPVPRMYQTVCLVGYMHGVEY